MEQQSRYIAELRNEIYGLKAQNTTDANQTQLNIGIFENNCVKAVDQNYSKVETLLLNR
jgi:hypothetical protein